MYQSPINLYETAMETIIEQRENAIFAKVQDAFDVQVDKAELIRALQYDRDQYDKGYADGKVDAAPKWIPVSERLPEDSRGVILCTRSRIVGVGFYDKNTRNWVQHYSGGGICVDATHWMPLPEPPEGEE